MTDLEFGDIYTFVGEGLLGNTHIVVRHQDKSKNGKLLSFSYPEKIVVVLNEDGGVPSARFFQNGREIQRCGSGSLAVAYTLLSTSKTDVRRDILTMSGCVSIGKKWFGKKDAPVRRSRYFCEFPNLTFETPKKSRFWKNIVHHKTANIMCVDQKSGYCVVELVCAKDVKKARVSLPLLKRLSLRALIITARSTQHGDDYVMRYFAPQYSPKEDAATGSANAILGQYWQKKLYRSVVRGRQVSPEGGKFTVEKLGNSQRVWGDISIARESIV